jgi:hypothetical protein
MRGARPRPIIVQKCRGSSVADVEKLGKLADRVLAEERNGGDVVVVSALGKATDGLLALARRSGIIETWRPGPEPPSSPCRWTSMHVDTSPAPGRYPIRLSPRWKVVILTPVLGVVVFGFFLDGKLVYVAREPAGRA